MFNLPSIFKLDPKPKKKTPVTLTSRQYLMLIEGSQDGEPPLDEDDAKSRRAKALEQAYEQRKFEIDLYWKRATYFWTFIGAAFVGYAAFLNGSTPHLTGALVMSQVGLVFTVAWYLVNRGSKFWQENWENHVHFLEDAVTGPIFKMCAERDPLHPDAKNWDGRWTSPQPRSVSKINTIVSMYVIAIWVALGLAVVLMWIIRFTGMEGNRTIQLATHCVLLVVVISSTWFAWHVLLRQSLTHQGDHQSQLTLRKIKSSTDSED